MPVGQDDMSDSTEQDFGIFSEALALSGAERAAFLAVACERDPELRRRVEALLRAHEEAGGFMETPPMGPLGGSSARFEGAGDRIGRYRLLQQIGEGGCGVVFMAEQETPVRRRVALKVVKPGMDTKSVIARFEAERQALALMDHPNIARVFDAGTTDQGRPYFVMELVRGLKITDYCDQNALPMEARLELFVQVCHAVEHAHQKGIIHRDLKPSNVLVTTTTEGLPQPKVIDFGIAKAVSGQTLTDKTLFTAFEMLIGTPAYMSPEQAELTSVDVDTRSDIYSLGVLLYELVTGRTPFDACDLLKRGLDEVRRVIRQQEPVRPSTKLGTLVAADLTAVATSRKAEPLKLIRSVRGDLDWIVLKTLEKNRTRRYQTASALAADIRHHLANETVAARPPSTAYRLRTMVRRHRMLFGGLAALVLSLTAGLVASMYLLARENEARCDADAARRSAETNQTLAQIESAKSRQVTAFVKRMLEGVGPSVAMGRDTALLREILEGTQERMNRELAGQPEVVAEIKGLLGRVYRDIDLRLAVAFHRDVLAWSQGRPGGPDEVTAAALFDLAGSIYRAGQIAEAEGLVRQALAVQRSLPGRQGLEEVPFLKLLAAILWNLEKFDESESINDQVLAIERSSGKKDELALADALDFRARALGRKQDYLEAEPAAREALAIRRRILTPDHPLIANSLLRLSITLGFGGRLAEAEAVAREVAEMRHRVLGADHPHYSDALAYQGLWLEKQDKLAEAERAYQQAFAILERLNVFNPNLSVAFINLTEVLHRRSAWKEAAEVHLRMIAKIRQRDEQPSIELGSALHGLGDAYRNQGDLVAAARAYGEAVEVRRKVAGILDASTADSVRQWVLALRGLGRALEAEQALNRMLTSDTMERPESAELLLVRADLLGVQGRWAEARPDAERAVALAPENHFAFHSLAPLLVVTGDRAAYRLLCGQIIARHGDARDGNVAERMAKDVLIWADSGVDLAVVESMVQTALAVESGHPGLAHFQFCRALLDYRRGRFASAMEWSGKVVASTTTIPRLQALSVLAMAQARSGQVDEGRRSLDGVLREAAESAARPDSPALGGEWRDWIVLQALLAEARDVLATAGRSGPENAP